jgi:hypothetical protein
MTPRRNYSLFNFGRQCHLDLTPIVADDDFDRQVEWWLNGRLFGLFISYSWKVR